MRLLISASKMMLGLALVVAFSAVQASVDEALIVGCGGFLTLSEQLSTSVPAEVIDFSGVRVNLLSPDGVIKYSTESVAGGYYFVAPIAERGRYTMRVAAPSGWSIARSERTVTIDPSSGLCSEQAGEPGGDINFELTGFAVTGSVKQAGGCAASSGDGDGDGVGGVRVTLRSLDGDAAATAAATVRTALSDPAADGSFEVSDVPPGSYELTAEHPSGTWRLGTDGDGAEQRQRVSVGWGAARLPHPILVTGYQVSGRIESEGAPVPHAAVALRLSGADLPLFETRSDERGEFRFDGVPCGDYQLSATYGQFTVQPQQLAISVNKGSVAVETHFQVVGFGVSGRVVDDAGRGVRGALVSATNGPHAVQPVSTDSDGRYTLQVRSGTYDVGASLAHQQFSTLTALRIEPSVSELPALRVERYDVCGRVEFDPSTAARTPPAVTIDAEPVAEREAHQQQQQQQPVATATVDGVSGQFCVSLPAGASYVLRPRLRNAAASIVLRPAALTVERLSGSPRLGVVFSQARVRVSGRVTCLLASTVGCDYAAVRVALPAEATGQRTATPDASGAWQLNDVVPGEHTISVSRLDNDWCWQADRVTVTVGSDDVSGIEFAQSAWRLAIDASHPVAVELRPSGASEREREAGGAVHHEAPAGVSSLCLPSPGAYEVVELPSSAAASCQVYFGARWPLTVEAGQRRLVLRATRYRLRGTVRIDAADTSNETRDASLRVVLRTSGEGVGEADQVRRVGSEWLWAGWAAPGAELVVEPTVVSIQQPLLVYPSSTSVTVPRSSCPAPVPAFSARPAIFETVRLVPPVADVEVSLWRQDGNGDGQPTLLQRLHSPADGAETRFGPLPDTAQYTVTALKAGYALSPAAAAADAAHLSVFEVRQLASIVVQVADEQTTAPVAGTLLSLSGAKAATRSFRSNNVTGADGTFTFIGLSPGQYFLRPVLKEYTFTPASQTVEVGDGQQASASVKARRVAFSAWGSVRSLSGAPEANVVVEAVPEPAEAAQPQETVHH
eukprot:TRINITY_DN2081_c0_g1_i1.p1 TRINITY_DN2081_c0_g1~~TRINITY_DN2081_c0_g1_i1.p1  ORF type:complete len:1017 (+),score=389.96 TRINITY_DN2081_c0_g1_i1:674-3724(+)